MDSWYSIENSSASSHTDKSREENSRTNLSRRQDMIAAGTKLDLRYFPSEHGKGEIRKMRVSHKAKASLSQQPSIDTDELHAFIALGHDAASDFRHHKSYYQSTLSSRGP